MKKIFYFLSLFFFLGAFFLWFSPSVRAQAGVDPNQVWICMKGEATDGFHANVTGSGFPTDKDIYMVACTEGQCSTGNENADQLLKISGSPNAIQFANGGLTRSANGTISTTATDNGYAHVGTAFFGVYIQEPKSAVAEGRDESLQQGEAELTPLNDLANCVSVYWDPFGRVFDTKSLEPIRGVSVAILDSNKNKVGRIKNPVITLEDGAFNFLVGEGTYYLAPTVIQGYTFTATPKLNQNYTKAYSDIYKPQSPILELIDTREEEEKKRPDPEHRDIPFDPGVNKPYEACPTNISYEAIRLGIYTRVEGKVSHPLTLVSLTQGKKELIRRQADNYGFYQLLIENRRIMGDAPLTVAFTKVDLTGANRSFPQCEAPPMVSSINKTLSFIFSLFSSPAFAQSSISIPDPTDSLIVINPILTYLEGYAYDLKGKAIVNAKVMIKLEMSKAVFYETKADATGYFQVDPKYIPIFPYYLEFVNPLSTASTVKMTTTDFTRKNKDYLTKNNVNLAAGTKGGKSVLPGSLSINAFPNSSPSPSKTVGLSQFDSSQLGGSNRPANNQPSAAKQTTSSFLLTILLLLFLILILGAGAAYLFVKMKKRENPESIPPMMQ